MFVVFREMKNAVLGTGNASYDFRNGNNSLQSRIIKFIL